MDGPNVKILKLGDFGLACEVNHPLYTVCGTPTYVAPEILAESGYGLKVSKRFEIGCTPKMRCIEWELMAIYFLD